MINSENFKNSGAFVKHLEERINAELKFAEKLCGFHKENAGAWQELIQKADKLVADAAAAGNLDQISSAVDEAEKMLAPIAKFAKNYSIYCVGHAHIDMNWMWPWQDTVATTIDSFSTVIKLMKEFPEFKFSQSQASVYAIVEKYNPELLAQIAKRVKEGRWEVTASHWVEGDKNLSGDESLCRHLLYTRRYMKKLFNLKPEDVEIDWAPDTFGHASTMPSYLVKGGVKYVYLHRPGELGPKRPLAFWWKAPDGAKVLVRNDSAQGYNGAVNPGIIDPLCNFFTETGLPYVMFVYGVGDHGGGPTRRDIMRAIDMDSWPIFPNVKFSTSREFFKRLEKDASWLPILECELNFELAGCYTTQTLIKKCNRFSENRINDAENVAALLSKISGFKYDAAEFEECWRDTLFSQFHDILPGSGVHDTRTYTHGLFQKTMASVLSEKTKALRQFASKIDTTFAGFPEEPELPAGHIPAAMGAGVGFLATQLQVTHAEQSVGYGPRPFLIFNTQACERNEIAEVTVWDNTSGRSHAEFAKLPFSVVAPDKTVIKPQLLTSGGYWGHNYAKFAFPVEIPGNGYAVYTIVEKETDKKLENKVWQLGKRHTCFYSRVERQSEGLENEFTRMEINMTTGGIMKLIDKRSGRSLIDSENSSLLEYGVERPHGMTAWIVEHTGGYENPQVISIERTIEGPYINAVKVRMKIHESDFNMIYEMRADDPKVYIRISGTWFQRGTPETGIPVLRFAVPFTMQNIKARYEVPFGAIDRECNKGEEVPALQWAQVTGDAGKEKEGCLLLNDSKYGFSLEGNKLAVTLIRSSYDPDILPEIGNHEINLALMPFEGDLKIADAVNKGRNFNHPLLITGTDVHKGPRPAVSEIVSVKSSAVTLSAVKKAENDGAMILRFYNTLSGRTEVSVAFNSKFLGKVKKAVETDIIERPLENSSVKVSGDTAKFAIAGKSIATIAVYF
ncbi:MAG TPA: hypothetical protein DCZ94_01905 [Lentisphaeria bacterium]|nr:MAG: hypothetical protein A2X48_22625 [Lentisphaerae bacterium GWF2_49_21]HBC85687.1 hypothetical protein [Lentisphaeria bacterium]